MGLFGIDTHTHSHSERVVPFAQTINVTEKKAPTDESIRLLNEFEDKAKLNIIAKIDINDNIVKASGVYMIAGTIEDSIEFIIKLVLNGKEILVRDKVDRFDWSEELRKAHGGFGNETIMKVVYKRFSEMLAMEILVQSKEFTKSLLNNGR